MELEFNLIHEDRETRGAVLLFHGLTGNPFELKKYGQFLFNNGFDVYAPSLPGHGDKVDEIYTVKYQDWLDFGYSKFEELSEKYENVFISGLCMGAVLALALGIKYNNKIKGIISLSTTLFLDGWRLPWYKCFMPIGLATILRFYYSYPECDPHGIKNERTRAVIKKLLQKSEVGMNEFPMTGFYELMKLSKFVIKDLNKITSPTLLMHSKEDDLTSTKSANIVYDRISSKNKELIILNDSYHMVLYDNEKEYVFNTALKFLNSLVPEKVREVVGCL